MKKLNSNHLKLIAIIAMTLDHVADLCYPGMPNNAVSNGFYYTRDLKKYISRLFAFAVISHFAYCFAFGINYIPFSTGSIFNQTSIMWTLAWSVVALYVVNGETNLKAWQKYALVILIDVVTFSADWSCIAVMAILSMYSNRGNLKKQIAGMSFWVLLYAVISFVFVNKTYGVITLAVILVYPLLRMYDGTKGKAGWMKWFFYLYYPLHLVMIGILRILMYGNTPLLFN